jgi:hypothetical protein
MVCHLVPIEMAVGQLNPSDTPKYHINRVG